MPPVLSGRLGLGSGNLNPATDDAAAEALGALSAAAAASPLALTAGARCAHTGLLLDARLREGGRFGLALPGGSGGSVLLDAAGLGAFLRCAPAPRAAPWALRQPALGAVPGVRLVLHRSTGD